MALNPWIGWGVTTLLSYFVNQALSSDTEDADPSELGAETATLGTAVPLVIGRSIIKQPLTIYYGGFSSEPYTETYSAHSSFNAWSIILSALAIWAATAISGLVHVHTHPPQGGPAPATNKEQIGPIVLNMLIMWLLSWLINGRMLKTTMQKGFKYYLGYQMLVCLSGAGIRVRGLYLNPDACDNEAAWTGDASRDAYPSGYTVSIDNEDLFGGADESGGFVGDVRLYMGGPTQPADSWMVAQTQVSSIAENLRGLIPAYRPFVSLVVPVAYVGKNASVPTTWVDVQFIPNRLGLGGIGDNDANPAEAIYEMIVNNEWGLGKDPAIVNVDSLIACGKTLATEGLGVSIKLTSRTKIQTVINNLCDHLDMIRYPEPTTGKMVFKLIRADYDTDSLPVITKSMVKSIKYSRITWSSSNGEVVAKYSDSAALYGESTVTNSDPAVILANNGDRNSTDVDFTYFTTSKNAAWAANRELKEKGFPLAAVTLVCNRKAYAYRQGDVFKLTWEPYGISEMVMRVTDIDLGDFVTGEITLEAVEDIFGVGNTTYGANDSTSWTKPSTYPTGVQSFRYFEAPWELRQSKESYVYGVAAVPDSLTAKWNLWRYRDLSWVKTNAMTKWTPTGHIVGSIAVDGDAEDVTGFDLINLGGLLDLVSRSSESGIALARNGSRLIMVDNELMGWGTITQLANGNFRLSHIIRAVHDTVPAAHVAGATAYFIENSYYANVTTGGPVCAAGSTVSEKYNITTATATSEETFDESKAVVLATARRSERPNPPGRIRMTSHLYSAVSRLTKAAGDVSLSWAIRNKAGSYGCVSQDDTVGYYDGQTIIAPTGLQTVIRAYLGATLIHEEILSQTAAEEAVSVLPTTPTTGSYTWAQRCLASTDFVTETTITIGAMLDSLESYQSHSRTFEWKPPYIVDACATEDDAKTLLASIYTAEGAVVSFSDTTLNQTIPIASMPLIILGAKYTEYQTGSILAQDGSWVAPNGTALAITGAGTYDIVTLASGYIVLSYMSPDEPGNLVAYQFDGTLFNRITTPAI